MHVDDKKSWEEIESQDLKTCELARDRSSIVSRISELLNESKVLLEFVYVKTRIKYDKVSITRDQQLILQCDEVVKL